MKNSASNPSGIQAITQALRTQIAQILPALTTALQKLGYHEVSHQRISQQDSDQQYHIKNTIYQGLTRAQSPQFGQVMIKWQLSPNNPNNNDTSNLSHEVTVLHDLNKSPQTQVQNYIESVLFIIPTVWAYKALQINILSQYQQLTILAMPYYPSGSLAHQLNDKKYKLLIDKQKHQFIIQTAQLITNLHKCGWLHNDIKPSNILLDSSLSNNTNSGSIMPKLLLTDFALANRFNESPNKRFNQECTTNVAGTPAYLAPERWRGQISTPQSDIYAFGIMIYEILTGTRPFKIALESHDPLKDWAIKHGQKPIPLLPEQYRYYQLVINKALAKRVERRYKSMEEVLRDLEEC